MVGLRPLDGLGACSTSAGALHWGQEAASEVFSHLEMQWRWYACLHGSVVMLCCARIFSRQMAQVSSWLACALLARCDGS